VTRQRHVLDLVELVLRGAEAFREQLDGKGPAARSLAVYAAPLRTGTAQGAILVLHDTTELRRLERVRQEFVANVSHELKTPLSVIKACIETLLDGAIDEPEIRGSFLDQVAEQSDRLHNLILDLLALAQIESGAEYLDFQAVDVDQAVQACLDRHRPRAEPKGIELRAAPGPGAAGLTAWADEEAVGRILDNLVDNAVKYTPPGGRVEVRWDASDGQAVLEVEDSGIGIPDRDLPRIFERFYRVDKARSRELGGTGLGLAIVKHLAQAMQGTVRAASQLGKGSVFTVALPRRLGGE
jgi:two-component system phosphate regulon sensor histidine kinase PhoR